MLRTDGDEDDGESWHPEDIYQTSANAETRCQSAIVLPYTDGRVIAQCDLTAGHDGACVWVNAHPLPCAHMTAARYTYEQSALTGELTCTKIEWGIKE